LKMLEEYNVDFCIHGNDVVTSSDGVDCYKEVKEAGKYREVERTSGVSTTDMVGRMLLLTKAHHETADAAEQKSKLQITQAKRSPYTGVSRFFPTTQRIVQFSEGKSPKPSDRIVYIDGTYDLFHVGHVGIMRAARQLGDYLLVGIHDDKIVNAIKGENYPIMSTHERVLSVLQCRFVDEVIIGAPYKVSKELLESQNVSVVVHGSADTAAPCEDGSDPYELPKKLGIYRVVDSPSKITTTEIINRILAHRQEYEARNRKKEEKELKQLQESKK